MMTLIRQKQKSGLTGKNMAEKVGSLVAERAVKAGVKGIVFDRNGFKYTGRIKLVADEARAGGLKF